MTPPPQANVMNLTALRRDVPTCPARGDLGAQGEVRCRLGHDHPADTDHRWWRGGTDWRDRSIGIEWK